MSRCTRIVTAALLLLALIVPAPASADDALPPGGTFVDDDGDVHEGYIEAIAAVGITLGCDPPLGIRYCPDAGVTRGQMAAFLRRAFGLPAADDAVFSDVEDSEFARDIAAIAAAGITKGCNPPVNTRYCPDDLVTRGQMAAFLRRAMRLETDAVSPFSDDDGSEFEHDITQLAAAGVARGCNPPDNTMFCPEAPVTRAQMASFIGRALHLTPTVPDVREVVFEGVPWSLILPYADHPEQTYGWIAADFFDRGVVMMDLREYDTPDVTVHDTSIHALDPESGKWVSTLLMPQPGDPAPLDFAADGGRVAVTAHPPSLYVFTRTDGGWTRTVVPLTAEVTGDEFGAQVAISGDRIVVGLDASRYAIVDRTGSEWDVTVRTTDIPYGTIDVDGPDIVFAAGESTYVVTQDHGAWTTRELSPPVTGHAFGSSVDVDDGRVLVAANGSTPGPGTSGAVYLYMRNRDEWQAETIATGGEGLGDSARLDGRFIVCGGRHSESGRLWIHEEKDGVWNGRPVQTGFESWVGDLALHDGMGVAIDITGLLGPHTAVLFGVD